MFGFPHAFYYTGADLPQLLIFRFLLCYNVGMAYSFWDSFRDGFSLVNRNWQLVLIKVTASIISCMLFFIIVGIPLIIAIAAIGLNFSTERPELFIDELKGMLTGGYMGFALVVIAGLVIYLFLALSIWVYVLAGTYGVLGKKLEDPAPFKLREFFSSAREFFWSFMAFYGLVGLGFVIASLLLGIAVGGAVFLVMFLKESTLVFSILAGVLLLIVIFSCGLFFLFASLTLGTFGSAVIVLEKEGAWTALKKAIAFLKENPAGFWGYCLLLLLYFLVSSVLVILGYPFQLIPFIGMLIIFPYQLIAYALERYMGLVLAGAAFTYYFRVKGYGSWVAYPPREEAPPESEHPEEA